MPTTFTSEIDASNDKLSAVFSALSDPTRRAMLTRLSQGEASVNELAAPFKMSLPAISKHIKVLEKAGLLTKTVNAQQRPCKIDDVQFKQAVEWILQNTIKDIATEAINTPARGKKDLKKQRNPEKATFPLKTPKKTTQIQEITHDKSEPSDLNNVQQQIGFDF